MGLSERSLKSLLPNASPFRGPTFAKMITAVAATFERAREFAAGVVAESLPSSATDTLERWFDALGLVYDSSQTLSTRRRQAKQAYTSTGGQNKAYLESILQEAYPALSIEEPEFTTDLMVGRGMVGDMMVTSYASWVPGSAQDGSYPVEYFRVVGEVESSYDLRGVQALLDRIAPAHLEPVFDVDILNTTATAEVGLGMVGLMEVGRTKDDE